MLYIDRSTMEADWRCGQERFWLTEWRPLGHESARVGGIVPAMEVWDLEFGKAFADGAAALLAREDPVDEIIGAVAAPMAATWGEESFNLLSGLLYGAAIHVIPRLMVDYEVLRVENECYYTYPEPPAPGRLTFMSRPDVVLRRRSDGTVWVPDWKTTKWKDLKWLLGWDYAVQLHLQAAAVQQGNPDWDVQGSIVLGAYKGYVDEYRGGGRISPFTVIYRRPSPQGAAADDWSPKYAAGWQRVTPTCYNGGIGAWAERMGTQWPTVLAEQFPVSHPIMIRPDFVTMVAQERLHREANIDDWRNAGRPADGRPALFEHRTANCKRCGYLNACWAPQIGRDPLAAGLYVPRMPNHELERAIMLTPRP